MKKIFKESDGERFCKMWRDGRSVETIAETFQLKPSTVRKYAKHKFNLPVRKRRSHHRILDNPDKVAFLKRNYSCMGDNVIAVLLGETPNWIRRTARRLGLSHSAEYRAEDYAHRAKKISATRKEKYARGLYPPKPKDTVTGRFLGNTK